MAKPHGSSEDRSLVDLEQALLRVLPRRSSGGAGGWAFRKRSNTVAETFQYVFNLVRETLAVREADLELGDVQYAQSRHGVALSYQHAPGTLVSADCSQGVKRLSLIQSTWKKQWLGGLDVYKVNKNVCAERPESTLYVSARRSGRQLREEDCDAIRATFEAACRIVGGDEDPASGS